MTEQPPQVEALFLKLLEDNKLRLWRICKAYAHATEDQEDLFQEVVLNIWKSLPSFCGDAHINTFVYRIAVNVCMRNAFNLDKRKKHHVPIDGFEIAYQQDNPHKMLEKKERLEHLYDSINQFSEIDKSIALLYLEDLTYEEIGAIIGIDENYVGVKINRIKKKLIKSFQTYGK